MQMYCTTWNNQKKCFQWRACIIYVHVHVCLWIVLSPILHTSSWSVFEWIWRYPSNFGIYWTLGAKFFRKHVHMFMKIVGTKPFMRAFFFLNAFLDRWEIHGILTSFDSLYIFCWVTTLLDSWNEAKPHLQTWVVNTCSDSSTAKRSATGRSVAVLYTTFFVLNDFSFNIQIYAKYIPYKIFYRYLFLFLQHVQSSMIYINFISLKCYIMVSECLYTQV